MNLSSMNLSGSVEILNTTAAELTGRLSSCLVNLRGQVPTNPEGSKPSQSGGVCGEIERVAGKLYEAAQLVGELEAITAREPKMAMPSNSVVNNYPPVGRPY